MVRVLVGSENPVKIQAVREAFAKYFADVDVIARNVDSGVSHQPVNEETFDGAKNRALALQKINQEQKLGAQFCVGIEGGIIQLYRKWFVFGVMCLMDENGRTGFGLSPHFELPDRISRQLLNGKELGDVADELFGDTNSKQKGGAIHFLTNGVMDRKNFYVQGLLVALVPFLNKELYHSDGEG